MPKAPPITDRAFCHSCQTFAYTEPAVRDIALAHGTIDLPQADVEICKTCDAPAFYPSHTTARIRRAVDPAA